VAAEAVSSKDFQAAFENLPSGKQIEVEHALYEIEDDPSPTLPNREEADPDSDYAAYFPGVSLEGLIIDGSVDDYAIFYRVVDDGATIEVWYLVHLPGHRAVRPAKDPFGHPFIG
jgi:hypothetical protein